MILNENIIMILAILVLLLVRMAIAFIDRFNKLIKSNTVMFTFIVLLIDLSTLFILGMILTVNPKFSVYNDNFNGEGIANGYAKYMGSLIDENFILMLVGSFLISTLITIMSSRAISILKRGHALLFILWSIIVLLQALNIYMFQKSSYLSELLKLLLKLNIGVPGIIHVPISIIALTMTIILYIVSTVIMILTIFVVSDKASS